MRRQTSTSAITTGTAPIQNSQCQLSDWRMTPESTKPSPAPTPNVADSRPSAAPTRSRGNSSRMMPNDSGKMAPAAPCTARAMISRVIVFASAAPTVPTAKIPSEITSSLRLP